MLTPRRLLFILLALAGGYSACRQKVKTAVAVKDPNYKKAKGFLHQHNDSAFYYFNKVTTAAADSLQTAFAYNYMGRIQSEAGDYFGSQESLSMSLKYLNPANDDHRQCLAADYNELGLTSISLKNYPSAINYFNQVIFFSDKEDQCILLNNKALAYQEKKDYAAAQKIYDSILSQTKLPRTYARILTNLAMTKWLANHNYRPVPELMKALIIRIREKDKWGLNSSYTHLADYYATIRPDSAIFYAHKMLAITVGLVSPDDELEALEKLIRLSSPLRSKSYFARYDQLSDSLQTARSAAKNQFAIIRYEVERSKADNLNLQHVNTENRYQILKQKAIIYFAVVILIGAYIWYRKRKKRLELEKLEAIRESELKTSKKVHDVVANGLYRIMTELDHQTELDKAGLADKIEALYEQSRDISYEKEQQPNQSFYDKIESLVASFATNHIKAVTVGNCSELWTKVDPGAQYEVEHVIQELLVNMNKHSQADRVAFRFERVDEQLHIYYFDNGIGIAGDVRYKNGLTNTGNRIAGLSGTITFDTNVERGLKIHLVFPIFNS